LLGCYPFPSTNDIGFIVGVICHVDATEKREKVSCWFDSNSRTNFNLMANKNLGSARLKDIHRAARPVEVEQPLQVVAPKKPVVINWKKWGKRYDFSGVHRQPSSAECSERGRIEIARFGYRPFSNKEYVGRTKPESRKPLTNHEREQFNENRRKSNKIVYPS
jgi:hypothetical protein